MASVEKIRLADTTGAVIDPATSIKQDGLLSILSRIFKVLSSPVAFDNSQNRIRGTVAVESGTVTTVTTVTGITNMGNYTANALVQANISQVWAANVRNRIT
jgi:hypothetical protein